MTCKEFHQGFELKSPISFPTTYFVLILLATHTTRVNNILSEEDFFLDTFSLLILCNAKMPPWEYDENCYQQINLK